MSGKGRPKKMKKYDTSIHIRLTKEQLAKITLKAQREHLEVAPYVRKLVLDYINGNV